MGTAEGQPDRSAVGRRATGCRRTQCAGPELIETAWDAQPDPLNEREREILRLAEEGLSNKAIGLALNLSPGTVRNYLSESASKLGAANRIEAGRIARANGWL